MIPVPAIDQLPEMSWKDKLAFLVYKSRDLPQTECPVEHIFEDGHYIREMRIPAGTFFLGRAHRYGHKCVLVSGEVMHITEHDRRYISAPFSMHSTPGYQMVMYAVTDVIGQTIHPNPTDSRDTQALEAEIFESIESLVDAGALISERMEGLCLA